MTLDKVLEIACKANVSIRDHYDETGSTLPELLRFAQLVAATEREECAKVCDELAIHAFECKDGKPDYLSNIIDRHHGSSRKACAAAIRARENK